MSLAGKKGADAKTPPVVELGGDPVMADIVLHNASVRQMADRMTKVAMGAVGVALVALSVLLIVFFNKPEPKYFLADAEGRIMAISPVDAPYGDPTRLTQWVSRALLESFSFDFVGYQQKLASVRQYYTSQGYDKFVQALSESGLLETVKANRYVMIASQQGAPMIVKEGLVNGRYVYVIRVPLVITFYQGNQRFSADWTVEALVIRVPPAENVYGVSIHQIVAKRGS